MWAGLHRRGRARAEDRRVVCAVAQGWTA